MNLVIKLFNPRKRHGKAPKLQNNWEEHYKILKKINDVYCIRKSRKYRNKIVHLDRLATFHET